MKQNRLKQIVKWDGANQDKNVPKGTDQCNILVKYLKTKD